MSELEFLEDLNALLSEALDGNIKPLIALRTAAEEVRERIDALEQQAEKRVRKAKRTDP